MASSPEELVRIETRRKSDSDSNHEERAIEAGRPNFESRSLVAVLPRCHPERPAFFSRRRDLVLLLNGSGSAAVHPPVKRLRSVLALSSLAERIRALCKIRVVEGS